MNAGEIFQRKSIASKINEPTEAKVLQKLKKENTELLAQYPAESDVTVLKIHAEANDQ